MSKPPAPNKEISGQIEKSELLERLKAWAAFLSEIDQEEDKSELDQICASLVSPDLLEYQDADVKLFVACCAADVLRIYAPEAPYADEQLKEIFMMFVEQLRGLEDIEGKSFKRYFYLLENLACVKTFILCMELDAPDIILSLFRTFFQIFNDRHVGKVQTFMVDIMMTVMQEGDSIPQDVMDIILMHIIQPYKSRKPAAHRLAKELINKSSAYMEPNIQKFFNAALMKGLETDSGLHSRVYDLIKELNRVCPSILLAVLPQLQEKLKSADVNERLEVTRLLAEMFSDKGSELATQNKQLWNCFLRRFNDIEAAVRAECVSTCKNFILNHLTLSDDCYSNLCKRHRDPDEKVRLEAVKVVYAIASEDITRMTPELFLILQERMLDKKWPIRHQAIMNVARLYKEINNKKDPSKIRQVAWMPNKVLHTYYQNTSQDRLLVERLLLSCLVPVSLGAKDRMNILLRTYCLLDAAAIKALNELLRYQQTIRMHLAALLKAIEQGIGEEDRKKLLNQVSMLSKSLPDSKTANSDLKRLSNTLVHDRSLLKAFQTIVTPGVSCQQVARAVSEIMKKLTNKNPIMDTIRALMDRTAPVLADSTCITVLVNITSQLLTAPREADSDDEDKFNVFVNGQKGLHLILSLATVYPGQFKAEEVFEQLLVNLKNPDNEVVLMDLKILAKTANGLDKRHPTVAGCLQPQLLKLAKEGTPSQAKQAIQVIHAVYQDSPKVLERLLESIVGLLDADHPNLPSIVKAVAQIAKVAPKIFEEFSRDVVRDFLLSEILTQDRESAEENLVEDDYWCEEDELSKDARVKIEGLHVMVNWVSRTAGDKTMISTPVLKLLWALLQQKGDMNGNSELRLCSMSHLRLHAGLCVLKLAGEPSCFDLIPLELFQEVAWLIQDPCPQVKQAMLNKLQKGLTSMKLPLEYVALLAFYATDVGKERRSKARQILLRVIQLRRDFMVMNSSNSERNHTVLPEYALPTLIHLLAHHPNMNIERKDSLKSSLDVLWWFLEPLMQKNDNFPFLKKLVETVKQAVDAIDPFNETLNEQIYAVCDLAFGVINCKCANVKLPPFPGEVKLSAKFFAPPEKLVPNTKTYIPDKFDFNPHRVPVAVEMDIDHPTVKARHVVAVDAPINKRSKKKFTSRAQKKPKPPSDSEDDEDEDDKAADNWIAELTKSKQNNEDTVEPMDVDVAKTAPEKTKAVYDLDAAVSEDEDPDYAPEKEPVPKKKRGRPRKVRDPSAEKVVKKRTKKPTLKQRALMEEASDPDYSADEITLETPELTVRTMPVTSPSLDETPKQSVTKSELFEEPEIPVHRPTHDKLEPQKVMKIKINTKGHDSEFIRKSFNSMYDQLIKNSYEPMPYYKRKSPSPERELKLPEKRLTLVSTRHQKKIGLDKVDLGQSPTVSMLSSTPAADEKKKKKLNDIRSFLTPIQKLAPVTHHRVKKRVIRRPETESEEEVEGEEEEEVEISVRKEKLSESQDDAEESPVKEKPHLKSTSSQEEEEELPATGVLTSDAEEKETPQLPPSTGDSAEPNSETDKAEETPSKADEEVPETSSQSEEAETNPALVSQEILIKLPDTAELTRSPTKKGVFKPTIISQEECDEAEGVEIEVEVEEEDDDDDGIPLLPVGEDSDDDTDENDDDYELPVKKPVRKSAAPGKRRGRPSVGKSVSSSTPVRKTATKSHPVANKSSTDKSNKRVAPRNPKKPPPQIVEAKIISEFTEEEPSFTVEIVSDDEFGSRKADKRKRKADKENDREFAAKKIAKNKARGKINPEMKEIKDKIEAKVNALPETEVEEEEEENDVPDEPNPENPEIDDGTQFLSTLTESAASLVASRVKDTCATMDDENEPEIRIKPRKSLRRSQESNSSS